MGSLVWYGDFPAHSRMLLSTKVVLHLTGNAKEITRKSDPS